MGRNISQHPTPELLFTTLVKTGNTPFYYMHMVELFALLDFLQRVLWKEHGQFVDCTNHFDEPINMNLFCPLQIFVISKMTSSSLFE